MIVSASVPGINQRLNRRQSVAGRGGQLTQVVTTAL